MSWRAHDPHPSCVVVFVSPPARQTSKGMADKVYFLPITEDIVTQVIEKERPDSIMLQFGGQTALACGLKLTQSGVLAKFGVRILGTPISTMQATDDRPVLTRTLADIGETVAPSALVSTVADALAAAAVIGYPIMVRSVVAFGSALGAGFADAAWLPDAPALRRLAETELAASPQLVLDKALRGWKKIDVAVARDRCGNCVAVCFMETFDPLGIHTGDSIVVAPAQSLTNSEASRLRASAFHIARHLQVVGECSIQFALHPGTKEVRARARSSENRGCGRRGVVVCVCVLEAARERERERKGRA